MQEMTTKYETTVVFYQGRKSMEKGIRKMQKKGWEVVGSELVPGHYGCLKTGCLGILFLPLALLGRKPDQYKVEYRRPI